VRFRGVVRARGIRCDLQGSGVAAAVFCLFSAEQSYDPKSKDCTDDRRWAWGLPEGLLITFRFHVIRSMGVWECDMVA